MAVTRLRLHMLSYGGTARELSRETKINAGRLAEYALGRRPIPAHHLMTLSATFGVNPHELVGEVEDDEMSV